MSERWDSEGYNANLLDITGTFYSGWGIAVFGRYQYIWKKGIKTLEVGVGSGKWSTMFALMGAKASMVDNSIKMLEKAQENFPIKFEEVIEDDILTLNKVPNDSYDVVFCDGLIEHFLDKKDRIKALQNLYAKINTFGYLFFTVPLKSKHADEHYYDSIEEMGVEAKEALNIPFFGLYMTATNKEGEKYGWVVMVGRKGIKIEPGLDVQRWGKT